MKGMLLRVGFLLFVVTTSGQVSAETQEVLSKLPDAYVHPLCLAPLLDYERKPITNQIQCDPALEQQPIEVRRWEGANGPQTHYMADYPRGAEEDWYAGFISYSVERRWTSLDGVDIGLLSVTNNTGGTGHFSSLWLVKKQLGAAAIEPLLELRGGDRCNDGWLRLIDFNDGAVTYGSAATPFRLLNPLDQYNWRHATLLNELAQLKQDEAPVTDLPGTFMAWKSYADVANSATACSGELINRYNVETNETELVGVAINRDAFLDQGQGIAQPCINTWLEQTDYGRVQGREGWIALDEWATALQSLRTFCGEAY